MKIMSCLHCVKRLQDGKRYCSICRKSVSGLDHHCPWLNTCIGFRAYPMFFLLTTCGAAQFSLQFIVGVLLLCQVDGWKLGDGAIVGVHDSVPWMVLLGVHSAGLFALASAYVSLFFFHLHIVIEGISTYEWMLRRRERKLEAKRKKRSDSEVKAEEERKKKVAKRKKEEQEEWKRKHMKKGRGKGKKSPI